MNKDVESIDVSKTFPAVVKLSSECKALVINSDIAQESALSLLASARQSWKKIDAQRKEEKAPFDMEVKKIQEKYNVPLTMLKKVDDELNQSIAVYRENKRQEALRLQRIEDAKYQKQLEKAEEKMEQGKTVAMPIPRVIQTPQKTVQTDSGNLTFRKTKTFDIAGVVRCGKVIDESAQLDRTCNALKDIPDEYFVLDLKRISTIVKAGGIVPGCIAHEMETPALGRL